MKFQIVTADIYLLLDKVVVDIYRNKGPAPVSIDQLLSEEEITSDIKAKAVKTAHRSFVLTDAEDQFRISPQGLFSVYAYDLGDHYAPDLGDRFSDRYIARLSCEGDRLVHGIILPKDKPAQEAYAVIVNSLHAE